MAKVERLKQVLCALILAKANEKMEVCNKRHTSYSEQLWLWPSSRTGQCLQRVSCRRKDGGTKKEECLGVHTKYL